MTESSLAARNQILLHACRRWVGAEHLDMHDKVSAFHDAARRDCPLSGAGAIRQKTPLIQP
jgi:hypothetical protein